MTTIIADRLASTTGTLAGSNQIAIEATNIPDVLATNLTELAEFVQRLVERINNIPTDNSGDEPATIGTVLSTQELRFLAQVSELDQDNFVRLNARNNVVNVDVFLSDTLLTARPTGGTSGSQIGGSAASFKTGGADFVFHDSNRPNSYLYVRINGQLTNDELAQISVRVLDQSDESVRTFQLATQFSLLPNFTTGNDRIYVLSPPNDLTTFTLINYVNGQSINVFFNDLIPMFSFSDSVNLNINDIQLNQLSSALREIISVQKDGALTAEQIQKLNGLIAESSISTIESNHVFYFKTNNVSNTLNDYHRGDQGTGIYADFTESVTYTVLVDKTISLVSGAEFRRVLDTTTTLQAVSLGTILDRNAYRITIIPAGFGTTIRWQLNGGLVTVSLTGANPSFKVNYQNLGPDVQNLLNNHPDSLPDVLRRLASIITIDEAMTDTYTRTTLQDFVDIKALALWDIDRHTVTANARQNELPASLAMFNSKDELTIPDFTLSGLTSTNYRFYSMDFLSETIGSMFLGSHSYVSNAPIQINLPNSAFTSTTVTAEKGLLCYCEFTTPKQSANFNEDFIKYGAADTQNLFGIDNDGLYLSVSNQDGSSGTNQVPTSLRVNPSQVVGGTSSNAFDPINIESMVFIPTSLSGSLTVSVQIAVYLNGRFTTMFSRDFTITNLASTQSFGSINVVNQGSQNFNAQFDYLPQGGSRTEHELTIGFERITRIDRFNTSATYLRSVPFVNPLTYRKFRPSTATSNTFSIWDSANTPESLDYDRHRLLFVLRPSSSSFAVVEMVYNGVLQTVDSSPLIDTFRSVDDFDISNLTIGYDQGALSRIMVAEIDLSPLNSENLLKLYSTADMYLGVLYGAGYAVETLRIHANVNVDGTFTSTEE